MTNLNLLNAKLNLLDSQIQSKESQLKSLVDDLQQSESDMMVYGSMSTQLSQLSTQVNQTREFLDGAGELSKGINRQICGLEHRKRNSIKLLELISDVTELDGCLRKVREALEEPQDIEVATQYLSKCMVLVGVITPNRFPKQNL